MMARILLASSLVASLLQPVPGQAQVLPDLDRMAGTVHHLVTSLYGLSGRVARSEEAERRIWFEVAQKFADYPEVAKLFKEKADEAQRSQGNQKQYFLSLLLDIACKSFEDSCQFRRDIEAIQARDRRQDDQLSEHDERIGRLEEQLNGRRHGSYYRGPIDEAQPAPAEPSPPRVWTYGLDRITDSERSLCPNALLIAECVDVPMGGGNIYHGNVYEDCRRQLVLVKHTKTLW